MLAANLMFLTKEKNRKKIARKWREMQAYHNI
jgi:hypothetical protein